MRSMGRLGELGDVPSRRWWGWLCASCLVVLIRVRKSRVRRRSVVVRFELRRPGEWGARLEVHTSFWFQI
jgi:hypothetical protein